MSAPPNGVTLRVISYNVHGLRGDLERMAGLVRAMAPDVLVVQEAPRRWRWRTRCADLAHRLGLFYAAGGAPALGNLLLVNLRVRIRAARSVRFPLVPGRHLRGAALAWCAIGGARFVVAGTHLSTDPTERPRQAHHLHATLATVDEPLIVAGDLNDDEDGAAWRLLMRGRADAATAAESSADRSRATFPASAPRARLDVIFVDPDIIVRGYHVARSEHAYPASDHLPIAADLVLPARSH